MTQTAYFIFGYKICDCDLEKLKEYIEKNSKYWEIDEGYLENISEKKNIMKILKEYDSNFTIGSGYHRYDDSEGELYLKIGEYYASDLKNLNEKYKKEKKQLKKILTNCGLDRFIDVYPSLYAAT